MTDYLKFEAFGIDVEELQSNELLSFQRPVDVESGELVSNHVRAEYKNLVFKIYDDSRRVFISGSLHKYKNNGDHNYDQFTIDDIFLVLLDLEHKFGINMEQTRITQLEAGYNCRLSCKSDSIVNSLYMYKFDEFLRPQVRNGNVRVVEKSQIQVKGYNKSRQYDLKEEEVFRFEVKFLKMQYLHAKGVEIYCLDDLKSLYLIDQLGKLVISIWDEVVVWRMPDGNKFPELLYQQLHDYYSIEYWNILKYRVRNRLVGKNALSNELKKMKKLQDQANISVNFIVHKIMESELEIIKRPFLRHIK